jgi:hypothetical protein
MRQEGFDSIDEIYYDDDIFDDFEDEPVPYKNADSTSEPEIDLRQQGFTDLTSGLTAFEKRFVLRKMERRKHTPVA